MLYISIKDNPKFICKNYGSMKFDYFQYSRDYDIMEVARLFVHYEFFFFRLKKLMISLVLAWGQRLERGRGGKGQKISTHATYHDYI